MKAFILAALAAATLATAAAPIYAAETGTKEWYNRGGDDNGHPADKKDASNAGSVRGDRN